MEPASPAEPGASSLSIRAIRALGSTRQWARFAGIALFIAALLKLVQTGFVLNHFSESPKVHAFSTAARHIAFGTMVVTALITIAIYVIVGWLALRYAERLNRMKPPSQPGSKDIVMALGAQHNYWRFQGIVIVAGLGLMVLGIIFIVIGIFSAAALHH